MIPAQIMLPLVGQTAVNQLFHLGPWAGFKTLPKCGKSLGLCGKLPVCV